MPKSLKPKNDTYIDSKGIMHEQESLDSVLNNKFDKSGGNITGNVNVQNRLNAQVFSSSIESGTIQPGTSKILNISPCFGLWSLRLTKPYLEVYKLYAFFGSNRWACTNTKIAEHTYKGLVEDSFSIEFINDNDKYCMQITNSGQNAFNYYFSKFRLLV